MTCRRCRYHQVQSTDKTLPCSSLRYHHLCAPCAQVVAIETGSSDISTISWCCACQAGGFHREGCPGEER